MVQRFQIHYGLNFPNNQIKKKTNYLEGKKKMNKIYELRRVREKKLMNIVDDELYDLFDPKIYLKHSMDAVNPGREDAEQSLREETKRQKLELKLVRRKSTVEGMASMIQVGRMDSDHGEGHCQVHANPMEFRAFQINGNAIYDKNCVTCGNENYEVTYHKQRHICHACRKHLKT